MLENEMGIVHNLLQKAGSFENVLDPVIQGKILWIQNRHVSLGLGLCNV